DAALDQSPDVNLVFGDQDLLHGSVRSCGRAARAPALQPGRRKRKVLPLPTSLSTEISPPKLVTISRQIGRPSPVPVGLSVSVSPTCRNFSKTASWSSGAIPHPVSLMLNSTKPSLHRRAAHRIPPCDVNFTAFDTRLTSTWTSPSRSA